MRISRACLFSSIATRTDRNIFSKSREAGWLSSNRSSRVLIPVSVSLSRGKRFEINRDSIREIRNNIRLENIFNILRRRYIKEARIKNFGEKFLRKGEEGEGRMRHRF